MDGTNDRSFEGLHCTVLLQRPVPGVVVLVVDGERIAELGDAPVRTLELDIARGPKLQLFFDGRGVRERSVELSTHWTRWLTQHKHGLRQISILTASPCVHLNVGTARRLADLGELLRVYTQPASFDAAVLTAIAEADG